MDAMVTVNLWSFTGLCWGRGRQDRPSSDWTTRFGLLVNLLGLFRTTVPVRVVAVLPGSQQLLPM
jgi:hypothetical protein